MPADIARTVDDVRRLAPTCARCNGQGHLIVDYGDGHGPGGEWCQACDGLGSIGLPPDTSMTREG